VTADLSRLTLELRANNSRRLRPADLTGTADLARRGAHHALESFVRHIEAANLIWYHHDTNI